MKNTPSTALKPYKSYGISRIDQPEKKNHGWYVRIVPLKVQKFFADKLHGSRRRALEQAENYRDLLFRELTPKQQERASRPRKKRGGAA